MIVTIIESSLNAFGFTNFCLTQLFKHPVDQCQSLTDCNSCLTSNNPICGWCALSRVCIRSSECLEVENRRVFVAERSLCPAIDSADPAILHLERITVSIIYYKLVCRIVMPDLTADYNLEWNME